MAREIDSKNRQFHPEIVTLRTPTVVTDGKGVTNIGLIEVDSHKIDLDDLSVGVHERYILKIALAVELEIVTVEQAENMELTMRTLLQNIDVMKAHEAEVLALAQEVQAVPE